MSNRKKLKHELYAVILVALLFAAWSGVFMELNVFPDISHVRAIAICVSGVLLFDNLLSSLNCHRGIDGLVGYSSHPEDIKALADGRPARGVISNPPSRPEHHSK